MVSQCRHIRTSGTQCGMIAMRHQNFCYYHQNCQPRRHRSTVRTRPHTQTSTQTQIPTYDYGAIPVSEPATPGEVQPPLQLLFPEDRASIQINLYRIAVAQAENRIDTRTASTMTWNQQVCMANLGKTPLIEAAPTPARPTPSTRSSSDDDSETYSDSGCPTSRGDVGSRPVTRVILTPDGDEIAPPVEILEDNEAEPIHHKGCPCLLCAEKYRNQAPEEHHPACQCVLCEEQEPGCREQGSEHTDQERNLGAPRPDSGTWDSEPATIEGAPSLAQPRVGSDDASTTTLFPDPCALIPKRRVARAEALLSGSTSRDPLNRPWSIAEYTFGDAIRRHEAQYAARAAAALAVGIEPPPYQPFITGLIRPGTPEWEEEQQMQQHSSQYWAEHFRKQIADRPDIQQYLEEEEQAESDTKTEC